MIGKGLTEQQRAFVSELLADTQFNITEAARRAGYKQPNKSGNQLMQKESIQQAIAKAQEKRIQRCELKADDVLDYLRTALFYNPLSLLEPSDNGWRVRDLDTVPDEIGRLIEQISVEDGEVTIKLVGKGKALDLSMKHLGLFSAEKHEVKQTINWDKLLEPPKRKTVEDKIDELAGD